MKKVKLTKSVQAVLISLLILLITVIVIGIFSGDKVNASETGLECSSCGKTMILDTLYYSNENHRYLCSCGNAEYKSHSHALVLVGKDNSDGTHSWTCTVCEKTYSEEHSMSERWVAGTTYHQKEHYCRFCSYSYKDTSKFSHSGGTHANGGTCSTCDGVYQLHQIDPTEKVGGVQVSGGGAHTVVYACSFDGCEYTYYGGVETCTYEYTSNSDGKTCTGKCKWCSYSKTVDHTGATHANGGKCTNCGDQYQEHGEQRYGWYKKTATTHQLIKSCTYSGCSETYKKTAVAHSGGTHENDGKCSVCDYTYQAHGQSETIKEYKKTETTHTPVYTCIYSDCTSTYSGAEEAHTGGTHANGGKCTTCGQVYQKHGQSTEIKEYKTTETGHIPVYKCTETTCTGTYEENEEAHTGATHTNGGKCTICEKVYQIHGQSTEVKEYKTTEIGHTPVYKCTESTCTETYEETEENHSIDTWSDNENGTHTGNCNICSYEITEEHNYQNGKCDKCNAIEPKEEEKCEHTYVVKNNENQHWEECSKCGNVKTGTLELHKFEKYTDNGDGTHSSTCSVCKYKLTEKHDYEDEKCEDCNSAKPEEKCEHTYVTKKR